MIAVLLAVWLQFTAPAYAARVDSLGDSCEPSALPLTGPVRIELFGWSGSDRPALLAAHAAVLSGTRDSFLVDPGSDQWSYYVVPSIGGREGCRSNLVTLNGSLAVEAGEESFWLGPPRPNPASRLVAIAYSLPSDPAREVELVVLDLAGRIVARPSRMGKAGGIELALWDSSGLRPGLYFVILRCATARAARRLLVLR